MFFNTSFERRAYGVCALIGMVITYLSMPFIHAAVESGTWRVLCGIAVFGFSMQVCVIMLVIIMIALRRFRQSM